MADTSIYKLKVEPFVRSRLSAYFGVPFEPKELVLSSAQPPQSKHGFDAVSADRRIVVGINASSGRTSRGKNPSGKITKAYQELYFLSLIEAEKKFLVLTDREFFDILRSETEGRMPIGVELLLCELSLELQAEVQKAKNVAASEVGG